MEKGKAYWLTIDAKGPGEIMVWLVGYPDKPGTAFGADAAAFQEALKEKDSGKPTPQKRGREPFIHNYRLERPTQDGAHQGMEDIRPA